jgi:hypothetical protein
LLYYKKFITTLVSSFNLSQSFNYTPYLFSKREIISFCIWTQYGLKLFRMPSRCCKHSTGIVGGLGKKPFLCFVLLFFSVYAHCSILGGNFCNHFLLHFIDIQFIYPLLLGQNKKKIHTVSIFCQALLNITELHRFEWRCSPAGQVEAH